MERKPIWIWATILIKIIFLDCLKLTDVQTNKWTTLASTRTHVGTKKLTATFLDVNKKDVRATSQKRWMVPKRGWWSPSMHRGAIASQSGADAQTGHVGWYGQLRKNRAGYVHGWSIESGNQQATELAGGSWEKAGTWMRLSFIDFIPKALQNHWNIFKQGSHNHMDLWERPLWKLGRSYQGQR